LLKRDEVRRGVPGLEGCIRTLLVIEGGSFPDEVCRKCEHLRKCMRLEPGVRKKLVARR